MTRIGVLTGGGDCPGLNAAIRAITVRANELGMEVYGIQRGWAGLLEADARPLGLDDVAEIHKEGGTMLYSSRTNPYKTEEGPAQAMEGFKKLGLDALIPIGGEDTLGVANKLTDIGLPCVAVPKTIDNDLSATDVTIGFNTAVTVATDSLDRVYTTMRSHQRVGVVEIMGRHAGWMAYIAGMAAGAQVVLVPEKPFDIEQVCKVFTDRKSRGKPYGLVACAEGAMIKGGNEALQTAERDDFGHVMLGGIGKTLAKEIEARTGIESRHTVLGHIQRGGTPTAFDRVLGTRLGYKAVELVNSKDYGKMVSLDGDEIVGKPLSEGVGTLKTVPDDRVQMIESFFGL